MGFAMKANLLDSGAETMASMIRQDTAKRARVRIKQRRIKFKLNREIGRSDTRSVFVADKTRAREPTNSMKTSG